MFTKSTEKTAKEETFIIETWNGIKRNYRKTGAFYESLSDPNWRLSPTNPTVKAIRPA